MVVSPFCADIDTEVRHILMYLGYFCNYVMETVFIVGYFVIGL